MLMMMLRRKVALGRPDALPLRMNMTIDPKQLSLIPFVCGSGASRPGSESGPLYCAGHDLTGRLAVAGIDAHWAIAPQDRAVPGRDVRGHVEQLARDVAATFKTEPGRRVMTIGGDHSMAAGSLAGAAMARGGRPGLVWVDAHPDLHSLKSSVSKALHGMPMGTLLGLDGALAVDGAHYPVFRPEDVLYAGLRDIDAGEHDNAAALGFELMEMDTLRRLGVEKTVRARMAEIMQRCDYLLYSIDLDGFSTDHAPAVGTPVPDGFRADEILPVLAEGIRTYDVPLIDIVEFNATLDGAEQTYDFINQVIVGLL